MGYIENAQKAKAFDQMQRQHEVNKAYNAPSPEQDYLLQRMAEENAGKQAMLDSLAGYLYEAQNPYPMAPVDQQYAAQIENYVDPAVNQPVPIDVSPGLANELMRTRSTPEEQSIAGIRG
jgi:hypothetical protein